ncbi:MAG: flagellar export chaperone FlgN [Clostridia bacterium]|jgi:flagellar biosynthesis/type III secretory pathway chaperone|nr:flagellar protein FlgN [Clostridiaceae bacterium]
MEQEKLYEKLLNVLLEEKAFFSRMLKLSEKKTDVIMHNRVKELEQIVSEEQSIFASLDEKEKTREALTKTLAQRLGPGLHEIHIQEIIDRMPSSYRSKFIPLVQELRMILRKQKEANDLNMKLLNNNLQYIQEILNYALMGEEKDGIYTEWGNRPAVQKRNIIDTKV